MDKIQRKMQQHDKKKLFDEIFDIKKIALSLSCFGGASLLYFYYKQRYKKSNHHKQ